MGTWVLERACRQLVDWQRDQPSMTVAVNLSVRQMLAPDIAGLIESVLRRTEAPAENLCLELTESVFMEDVDYFARTLPRVSSSRRGTTGRSADAPADTVLERSADHARRGPTWR
jgi:EAL domain-containing protein (putative c-di-GMP-specific phosphodiesterase class I)